MNLSQQIAIDLISNGVTQMYGVQGGACARIIDSFVSVGGKYKAVLNEQSAGYCAQGYYLKSGRPAAIVATTGPGATNLVSGIASCYFDNIPLVVLVGQIKTSLNLAITS